MTYWDVCGTGKKSGSDAIHGGARDVAPYYFLGLTSLAAVSLLLKRGPLPFYSGKNVRTVCSMKIRQLSLFMKTAYVA